MTVLLAGLLDAATAVFFVMSARIGLLSVGAALAAPAGGRGPRALCQWTARLVRSGRQSERPHTDGDLHAAVAVSQTESTDLGQVRVGGRR